MPSLKEAVLVYAETPVQLSRQIWVCTAPKGLLYMLDDTAS